MSKDREPRGQVQEFISRVPKRENRVSRRKPGRVLLGVVVPTIAAAAALSACSGSPRSLPEIVTVPSTSQLPPASPRTAVDYNYANQAVGDADLASVGDYSQVNQELKAIKNRTIAAFATAAADNAEAYSALAAADNQQFTYSSPDDVTKAINSLRVRPIRRNARRALDWIFADQAEVAADEALPDKKQADADVARISDPGIRDQAQRAVTLSLQMDYMNADNLASLFSSRASQIEETILVTGNIQGRILDKKAAA